MELLRPAAARRLGLRWRSAASLPGRSWICPSCRGQSRAAVVAPRRFTSTTTTPPSTKPYYVTTPIFYVNASPHIGHMYSMVLADVLKRWKTLAGERALLCTGTDEHGMKVQRAAALDDMPPKQFCDANAAKFEDLAQKSLIDNDFFIRTTDQDHVDAVKHFWFLLREKGYIYESKHEGWYCVSDECFYPESALEKKIDPFTGRVHWASIESGNAVEWTEEKNYHFRMTALKDRLLEFYEKNPEWVVPAARMNQVVDWVKNNLEDLSISRPVERLSWGIPVPDDPSQTVYVWVDALINYITKAGFPTWTPGREHEGGWPADVHVIGKDILRFHCVYWPALLLALDLPLPKRVLSHSHWTLDRKKMSKSIGNVVNPFFAIDRWGVDTMRFYLIHDGGIADDADYSNAAIVERYKKLLQWGLGNLTGRITRPKAWSVREAVARMSDENGITRLKGQGIMNDVLEAHGEMLQKLPSAVAGHMERLHPSAALRAIMVAADETNKFLTRAEPWIWAKNDDEASKAFVTETVYLASESLRAVGILLQPFIPDKATELLDRLGVAKDKRTLEHARPFSDTDYGTPLHNPGKGSNDGLFPPQPVED
ncbi:methionyl-tRNA synthetase [Diplogelasinospora grovesii]|uniref:Probable methionine--tRNA ligase, mitochondrial n=1 Tax=Diplogelasinospora grovesii TaxID=303347 RepID=A0AAN6NHI0_9PEZI|nr:methionyl-tRNA synthetase [Diplogelasinospora grovesii]